ncbi:hypothetical protein GCM10025883_27100 [Mobilicoccus caccae]|uniref:DUF4307 domain-containing protein n=1 Tax=Mobilicoccus caccae TaxID=1859295 RepID=A0ABQ6ITG6_9MICO|nr:hypothetical protein GCM10025883_27100 [Mobilicoccus caccae]
MVGVAATVGKPMWGNLAFDVRDDRHVEVTYQLTRPTDATVECIVVAKEMNHGTVGTVTDTIPPGPEASIVRTVEVRTTSRAVMGEVSRCRAL